MSAKEQFVALRDRIQQGDSEVCGQSPVWIHQELVQLMNSQLDSKMDSERDDTISDFSIAAVRFIADNCGSECDDILEAFSRFAK